jgi:hypothetical protein
VRLAALEETLPDKCFTQKKLNILLRPVLGRQGLQKHHYLLKVHPLELLGPLYEECSADVKVEGGEALIFGL